MTAVQTPYFYFIHVSVANGCTNITPIVRFPKAIEVHLPKTKKKMDVIDVMICLKVDSLARTNLKCK